MAKYTRFSNYVGITLIIFLISCGREPNSAPSTSGGEVNRVMICAPDNYQLNCLKNEETEFSDQLLALGSKIRDEVLDYKEGEVSDERQDEYGEESKAEVFQQFPNIPDHPKLPLLQGLLHKLLKLRSDPSEIDYHIYVVRSDMVNAFTVGGEIFVTQSLLDESGSIDELACVIGHEVGHNELDHIAKQIKEQEMAMDLFGKEAGQALAGIGNLLTMGFNQRSEAEADLFGIDLAISSGYDACRGIDFWRRMQTREEASSELGNLFRSHPYSSERASCYRQHLSEIHQNPCER